MSADASAGSGKAAGRRHLAGTATLFLAIGMSAAVAVGPADAQPAKVIQLARRDPPPMVALLDVFPAGERAREEAETADQYFMAASILDDGNPTHVEEASAAYRRALGVDPYMVPALINLANLHYSRDEIAEAQALYERAITLDDSYFEAHFNLGNIHHDHGRYAEAEASYRIALALNYNYADAHFYLAVTLEKMGRSIDARAHWKSYERLAPNGEWVELAREFSD